MTLNNRYVFNAGKAAPLHITDWHECYNAIMTFQNYQNYVIFLHKRIPNKF